MPSSACKNQTCRSEEHTSELQSHDNLVCRLLLEKKHQKTTDGKRTSQSQAALALVCGAPRLPLLSQFMPPSSPTPLPFLRFFFFFFNDTATTEIYTLSLHDALPISRRSSRRCPTCSTSSRARS